MMKSNKLYKINGANTKLEKIISSIQFFLSFRPFKAFSVYLLHKTNIVFFEIRETDKIAFLDANKNVLIEDKIEAYTFFKPAKKIFEIEHVKLKKNIPLILKEEVYVLINFLKNRDTKFEKPKKISFWSIIELIFMS